MAKSPEAEQFARIDDLALRGNFEGLGEILAKDPLNAVRRRAMEALFRIKPPEALDVLADVASGPEMGLNEEILTLLRDRPGDKSLNALARVLSSENSLRRAFTVSILASRKEPSALVMLLRGARDPMPAVRRIAESALIQRVTKDPQQLSKLPRESIAGIVSFVPCELAQELIAPQYPPPVRAEALKRLAATAGAEAVTTLMALSADEDPILTKAAWDGLRSIKDLPATYLLPFLADSKEDIRRQGVELFARTCGGQGGGILSGLLRDRSAVVREATIRALYQIEGEAAIPSIRKLLKDPVLCVRRVALQMLARSAKSTGDLIDTVLTECEELQKIALMALADHGVFDSKISDSYLKFLNAHSSETSASQIVIDAMASIAKILGDANEPRALDGFAALCRSSSRRLRRTGIEAILAFPPDARSDVLDSLADTHDRSMLSVISISLAEAKDPRASIPLVRTYVECGGRPARRAFELLQFDDNVKNVDFLIQLLGNKWASVRRYGASQLKDCKETRVIEPLLNATTDDDPEVQLVAIEALGPFAREHEKVANRLIESCSQGDVTVRQAGVEALGEAQVVSAVPVLIKALQNVFLRPRAEEALKKVGGRQGYLAMKRIKRREQLFGNKNKKRKEKKRMPV
ncbi:MAG: HEAT repeat domain-containing protein [Planctomycetota bacterium]